MEELELVEELSFLEKLEKRKTRFYRKRTNFFDEFDDEQFKRRFRLEKYTVIELTKIIGSQLEHSSSLNNALSPIEQVLIALRFYACGSFQLVLGDLFQVSQPTICRVVHRVSQALTGLCREVIELPKTDIECKQVCEFITIFLNL